MFHIFFREIWCYMSAKDYRVFQYHYEAMLNETAKDYALDLNNDALNKYKPENLKK